MPQLDIYIISTQIFWLLVKFNFFYFFMLKHYIVEVSKTFKLRNKLSNIFKIKEKEAIIHNNFLGIFLNKKTAK
jgi:hypothetical protein